MLGSIAAYLALGGMKRKTGVHRKIILREEGSSLHMRDF
jgi:hypothetical protein